MEEQLKNSGSNETLADVHKCNDSNLEDLYSIKNKLSIISNKIKPDESIRKENQIQKEPEELGVIPNMINQCTKTRIIIEGIYMYIDRINYLIGE